MLLRSEYKDDWSLRPIKIVEVPIFFAFDQNAGDSNGSESIFEENFTKVMVMRYALIGCWMWC
jgi:hypothetical protein